MKHKKVFLFSGVLLIAVLLLSLFGVVKPQNTNRSTSVQDSQTAKSDVTIAVVNEDRGTLFKDQFLNVGTEVVSELKTNESIGWVFVDRKVAEEGTKR